MNIDDFNYNLPENLIAQSPLKERRDSRLLIINPTKQTLQDSFFKQFTSHLSSNDLVIFNDTKVIKARLFGKKLTGGKVELLIERIFDNTNATAIIKTSKTIKSGMEVMIDKGVYLKIISRKNNLFHIRLNKDTFDNLLKSYGHIPLPPYIQREDKEQDIISYQTIYAKNEGAVAAPTAGLHFSQSDFKELNKNNIATAFLTLHVGSGTFQPVKVSDINDHIMHEEVYCIDTNVIDAIAKTKAKGGRIIAIGTTVLRALESAFAEEEIKKDYNVTKIFIKPGFKFKVVDALFTNFHLPKSTLLMLISAFAGSKFTKKAYNHAIEKKYRFFSYGDAMFIEQKDQN
jgi:S-adenosylmethionine:tRNA ribosyltransferase-isomerase